MKYARKFHIPEPHSYHRRIVSKAQYQDLIVQAVIMCVGN
jgi:hypothetical protein